MGYIMVHLGKIKVQQNKNVQLETSSSFGERPGEWTFCTTIRFSAPPRKWTFSPICGLNVHFCSRIAVNHVKTSNRKPQKTSGKTQKTSRPEKTSINVKKEHAREKHKANSRKHTMGDIINSCFHRAMPPKKKPRPEGIQQQDSPAEKLPERLTTEQSATQRDQRMQQRTERLGEVVKLPTYMFPTIPTYALPNSEFHCRARSKQSVPKHVHQGNPRIRGRQRSRWFNHNKKKIVMTICLNWSLCLMVREAHDT